uniref:LOW QUALITY PROTEIN: integrin alpha-7-like n=1 Tax=Agelaius phoeniceus TaxID=39638 RepID=UPI0023EDB556|nr:LOW QUALITY PROTEIN: integrin alpha-7-like [Agelaius phoeniceus]
MASGGRRCLPGPFLGLPGLPGPFLGLPGLYRCLPGLLPGLPGPFLWLPELCRWLLSVSLWLPGLYRCLPGLPGPFLWLPGLYRWLPGLCRWLLSVSLWLPGLSLQPPGLCRWLPALSLGLPALSLWLPAAAAFNLDGASPVLKDGDRGSLFGAAVALHRQLSPEPRRGELLVGAPQARALPGQAANISGALFACPLSAEPADCWRVPIDEGEDPTRESKENQWLGVSVESQGPGGKVVTCAHRYELRHRVRQPLETRDVIGRCFVLSQDLRERDELDGGEWKFCEGRAPGHERFGFCQQGLAAAFSPDRRFVLLGAPGTYNWKGTVRLEQLQQSSLDLLRPDAGPFEAGGEKEQDPALIPVPAHSYLGLLFVTNIESGAPDLRVFRTPEPGERVPGAAADVGHNSYLGFSVAAGPGLTRPHELSFVSGAPRANHSGAVVILRTDSANRLVPEAVLGGHQLSSAFGHALALLDLNSDGWTDLAVGAPHFFERQEELGGAVYVYLNPGGLWAGATPERLSGPRGSAFGTALCSAGDLDRDGFQDLAVGAPFDGAGKVFIYHGSALGIVTRPAQVLDGEAVGVSAFGYSLSGGMDVDGNLYPDLLVGSLSDSVVLYRARPVVHVSREVSVLPPLIDLERSNCRDGARRLPGELQLALEADSERRLRGQQPRGSFLERGPAEPEHRIRARLELPRPRERRCVPATFRLHDDIRDKLRPIAVTLSFAIAGDTAGVAPGGPGDSAAPAEPRAEARASPARCAPSPALSPRQPSTLRTEVHFLRQGCGDDRICQSHLELRPRFCARLGDSDFLALPTDEDGAAILAISDQKDVALELQVTNEPSDPAQPHRDGDDAHQALLVASLPPELPYAAIRGRPPQDRVLCLANANGSRVECELGNPLKRGAQVRFFLILSTSGVSVHTTELQVLLELSTSRGLEPVVARARVVIELPLAVTGVAVPPRLFFGGQVLGESAVKRESQVGSAVRFEVTVSQRGPVLRSPGSAALTVQWPLELPNGKWLLYPLSLELGTPPVPCSPPGNPLHLALESPGREGPPEEPPARSWWVPAGRKRRNVTLDCARGTARCRPFRCPAAVAGALGAAGAGPPLERDLPGGQRETPGEFLDVEKPGADRARRVSVSSPRGNVVIRDAVMSVSLHLDPGVAVTAVPWWVLPLAVLLGLLLLALLVLGLWKLGFFRRAAAAPPPAVPRFRAVRIPREQRPQAREGHTGTILRPQWAAGPTDRDGDGAAPGPA